MFRTRAIIGACLLATACGREPASRPATTTTSSPTASTAPAAPALRVYVTNEGSGDLSIIDGTTLSTIATVPLGKRPRGIQASRDRTRLYVALSGSPPAPPGVDERTLPPPDRSADGIGEIDIATGRLLRVLQSGTDPEQVAVSADGTKLFVANEDAAQLSVFDLTTNAVIKTVKVGAEPEGVTVSPNGKFVYVTSEDAGTVHAIDTATFATAGVVEVGPRPRSIEFTPDGTRAFVTVENGASVAVVDAVNHKLERSIELGEPAVKPMGIATDQSGRAMFVTTGRFGALMAIDTATGQVTMSLAVGPRPWGVAVTPDGARAFTANGPSNDVSVVDLVAKQVVRKIPVGERPWGVAIVAR